MQAQESKTEVQKLVDALSTLPAEQQEALAAQYRAEVEQLREMEERFDTLPPEQTERLRALIQEGIDSGPATPLDVEAVIRRNQARWNVQGQTDY